ncbi:hypothetical protein C8T65DRAFT_699670 [Cerioporus squamosus]|nr:hypothetical protein C8T65DRAFT_699670 [Cerioporus squamosus]
MTAVVVSAHNCPLETLRSPPSPCVTSPSPVKPSVVRPKGHRQPLGTLELEDPESPKVAGKKRTRAQAEESSEDTDPRAAVRRLEALLPKRSKTRAMTATKAARGRAAVRSKGKGRENIPQSESTSEIGDDNNSSPPKAPATRGARGRGAGQGQGRGQGRGRAAAPLPTGIRAAPAVTRGRSTSRGRPVSKGKGKEKAVEEADPEEDENVLFHPDKLVVWPVVLLTIEVPQVLECGRWPGFGLMVTVSQTPYAIEAATNFSISRCDAINWIAVIVRAIAQFVAAVFTTQRAYGLSGGKVRLAIVTFFLSNVACVVNLLQMVTYRRITQSDILRFRKLYPITSTRLRVRIRILTCIALMVLVTGRATYQAHKAQPVKMFRRSLASALSYDGSIYVVSDFATAERRTNLSDSEHGSRSVSPEYSRIGSLQSSFVISSSTSAVQITVALTAEQCSDASWGTWTTGRPSRQAMLRSRNASRTFYDSIDVRRRDQHFDAIIQHSPTGQAEGEQYRPARVYLAIRPSRVSLESGRHHWETSESPV